MQGFETETTQRVCVECGAEFEDPFREICPACMTKKNEWFWELWEQTHELHESS